MATKTVKVKIKCFSSIEEIPFTEGYLLACDNHTDIGLIYIPPDKEECLAGALYIARKINNRWYAEEKEEVAVSEYTGFYCHSGLLDFLNSLGPANRMNQFGSKC